MESILALSLTQNASDVHLSSGENIIIRRYGELLKLDHDRITNQQLEQKLLAILNSQQRQILKQDKQLDFAYEINGLARFRGHIFYQNRGISVSFRLINYHIPSFNEIQAPDVFKHLVSKPQGLILISGATGSGKSTTLASMINYINLNQKKHIITLEDPIEFLYESDLSLIQQRQIGIHCHSYNEGLVAVLREDPDVIVIGELRDQQTISAALQAAETGHIVFATLHTHSAIATVSRIIDTFPDEAKPFIRSQLAHTLQAIISQRLVPDAQLGRKAQYEILLNLPAISNLIQEGKIKQIISIMQTGRNYGMQNFD